MQQQAGVGPVQQRPDMRAEEEGPDYERQLDWREQPWSYSLEELRKSFELDRQQWQRIRRIYESQPYAVGEALPEVEMLGRSQFAPALAAVAVSQTPSVRNQLVDALQRILAGIALPEAAAGPARPGRPGAQRRQQQEEDRRALPTRRAAALALRRLGGDRAARALFFALVGPEGQLRPQQDLGGRPPGVGPPAGIPGIGSATQRGNVEIRLAAVRFAARALGGMGRADLLEEALDARGRAHFEASPLSVRAAALEGLAFLPLAEDPIAALKKAIGKIGGALPSRPVAEALDAAFQRVFGLSAREEVR
jgi:hypothetical protein